MTDIDHLLARMAALPPDPRLPGIEAAVLAGLDAPAALPGKALGALTACALVLGVMAGTLPARHRATPPADPLAVTALAPSTLLADAH
jgi:hypothetical protein